ncbi:MAG: DMT family transporter, partial [Firmicutes bacterium]|nr:DMT family transporter [Bacillota bacterium]
LTLLPVVALTRRTRPPQSARARRNTWVGGVWCGAVLFAASAFQQFGILHTTVGKAGFVTALYIVLVPLSGLFLKRRTAPLLWAAVALAAAGLYLLCFAGSGERFSVQPGDLLVLCCAFLFTAHILVVGHFSSRADCVAMSCVQFFIAGGLGLCAMFRFEKPAAAAILDCRGPLLYAGVLSSGVAYTLQIIGQKNTNPAEASLLLSLEAVFGALGGALMLGERFTGLEFAGAGLMFVGIVLSQWGDGGTPSITARFPKKGIHGAASPGVPSSFSGDRC